MQEVEFANHANNGALVPLRTSALRATQGSLGAPEQDPDAVEEALSLDRPTRRLIQEGLRNEGFDPGAPDGLFGRRTRSAIRQWQETRGVPPTGYLSLADTQLLAPTGAVAPSETDAIAATALSADTELTARDADGSTATQVTDPANQNSSVVEGLRATEVNPRPEPEPNREESTLPSPSETGQLPPAILVDRHLVRVERLLAENDARTAHRLMDEIIRLQQEHDLVLPDDFDFQYAQVAFRAGRTETAIDSLNEYLVTAGRDGEFYRDALALLDSAEETLRDEDAERRRVDVARRHAEARQHRGVAWRTSATNRWGHS